MTFGAPPDPRYLSFKQGIKKANDDFADRWRWRWAPGHGAWLTYSADSWIMNDVGIADTTPGLGLDFGNDSRLDSDLWWPDLFARLDAVQRHYRARFPDTTAGGKGGLVWTWRYGGDWRVAIPHPNGGGHSDPPPNGHTLPPECLKRIEDVREYVRRGIITAAQGQRLINEIVADCT